MHCDYWELAGGVTFCVVMALPPYLRSTGHVLTETVAELTLALGLHWLLHWLVSGSTRFLWPSAVAFAYSRLTRPPNAAVMLLALLPSSGIDILVFRDRCHRWLREWATPLLAALTPILVLVTWVALIWYQHGAFVPNARTGYHLSTRVIPVIHLAPEEPFAGVLAKHRDLAAAAGKNPLRAASYAEAELKAEMGLTRSQISERLRAISLSLILSFPSHT